MSTLRQFAALIVVALGFAPGLNSARAADPAPYSRSAVSAAPVVHLLAIAETHDPDIAPNVRQDAENVVAAFRQAFREAGKSHMLLTRLMTGREVTAEGVLAAVADLGAGPRDTVVVFVSGHGGIDSAGRHRLSVDHGPALMRDDLLAAMKSAGPRLCVLLTDVCSSYLDPKARAGRRPVVKPVEPVSLPRGDGIPWRTVEDLLLSHRGVVDVTAAEPGFPAATEGRKPGSFFTNALLGLLSTPRPALVAGLDRNSDRAVQWDEVLPQLRGMAAERQAAAARVERPQQATARSLGRWAVTAGGSAK